MIHWLADDPNPQNNGQWWPAYLTLGIPLAVAFVAGRFQVRTTQKSPYEKLEKLIGVLKDWPEDLTGKETMHREIQLALSEIRRAGERIAGVESVRRASAMGWFWFGSALVVVGQLVPSLLKIKAPPGWPGGTVGLPFVILGVFLHVDVWGSATWTIGGPIGRLLLIDLPDTDPEKEQTSQKEEAGEDK